MTATWHYRWRWWWLNCQERKVINLRSSNSEWNKQEEQPDVVCEIFPAVPPIATDVSGSRFGPRSCAVLCYCQFIGTITSLVLFKEAHGSTIGSNRHSQTSNNRFGCIHIVLIPKREWVSCNPNYLGNVLRYKIECCPWYIIP